MIGRRRLEVDQTFPKTLTTSSRDIICVGIPSASPMARP